MSAIKNVDELAAVMFEVLRCYEGSNADFAASMVSCAVTVGVRDGLDDEAVLRMVERTAKASLEVARAQQKRGQEVH